VLFLSCIVSLLKVSADHIHKKTYPLKVEHPRTNILSISPLTHSIVIPDTFRHANKNNKKYLSDLGKDTALRDAAPVSPLRRIANCTKEF